MMAEHVPGAEELLTVRNRFWSDAALAKVSPFVWVGGCACVRARLYLHSRFWSEPRWPR